RCGTVRGDGAEGRHGGRGGAVSVRGPPGGVRGPPFVAVNVNVTSLPSGTRPVGPVSESATSAPGSTVGVTTLALLFAAFVSEPKPDAVAALLSGTPATVGVTTIDAVAVCPIARPPNEQVTVPAACEQPAGALADTNVTPAGSTSVTVVPVETFGPLFVRLSV